MGSYRKSAGLEARLSELMRIRQEVEGDNRVPGMAASLDYLIAETTKLVSNDYGIRLVASR